MRYLCPLQHVVDDVVHLRYQSVQPHLQQHHDGPAHVLPDLRVLVTGEEEEVLNEVVNVDHERLTPPDDELVDAGDGMRSDLGVVVPEEGEELNRNITHGSATKESHLGYEDIERSVKIVGVQYFSTVLAYLLQGSEASLAGGVVITGGGMVKRCQCQDKLTCPASCRALGGALASCVTLPCWRWW